MKTVFVFAALVCSIASFAAQAEPRIGIPYARWEEATLTEIRLDPNYVIGNHIPGHASLLINDNQVHLALYAQGCPAGQVCIQTLAQLIDAHLPIVKQYVDGCGSRVIVAEKDRRPMDGNFRRITVRDNTQRRCRDLRSGVEVQYRTISSGFNPRHEIKTTTSFFFGNALEVREAW